MLSMNMHIPIYLVLLIVFVGISVSSAYATTVFTDGILNNVAAGNSVIEARSDGGNAAIKLNDLGTSSWGFTVFDNTNKFDITDLGQAKVRLSIISNGNVGIGTQSPTEKLTVKGDIGLSGNIIPSGDLCIGSCP